MSKRSSTTTDSDCDAKRPRINQDVMVSVYWNDISFFFFTKTRFRDYYFSHLQYLYKLYGKDNFKPSPQKIKAMQMFQQGRNLDIVASIIGVKKATAEVYVVDALATGATIDHERLAGELCITSQLFYKCFVKVLPDLVQIGYISFRSPTSR